MHHRFVEVPQPLARIDQSSMTSAGLGAITLTGCVTSAVAPPVIGNGQLDVVRASSGVAVIGCCTAAGGSVAEVPMRTAIVPSGSLDGEPFRLAVRSVVDDVKAAVGSAFGSVTVMSLRHLVRAT